MWPRSLSVVRTIEPTPAGYLAVEPPAQLLAPFHRLKDAIRATVGLPESHWQELYLPVLHNYAALCQRLPASEAHHHAELGGLLRHGLETILEALLVRRNQLLPPGAAAEEIARQEDLWTYATATSALLHDVGKPITDLIVKYISPDDTKPRVWQPLTSMLPLGAHYRFRFDPERQYHRHALMPPLLAHRILPHVGLNWLASEPAVLDAWLATVSGVENAGPLSTIAHEADGTSVARDLSGGIRTRPPAARAKPLAERLLTGVRRMVKDGTVALNRPGATGFIADGSLWLVSKRVLDDLRAHLTGEGQTGIPGRNDRLMDELQQWRVIEPNGDQAVWYCDIRVGEWRQPLSCLRINLAQLWPDSNDVPTADDVSVVPMSAPSGAASTDRHADSATASTRDEPCPAPRSPVSEVELPAIRTGSQAMSATEPPATASVAGQTTEHGKPSMSVSTTAAYTTPAVPMAVDDTDTVDVGHRFVEWLKDNIRQGTLEINTPRARVHVLTEGLALITPGIFRDFSPEHWDRAQKRFQKLRLHAKTEKDTNIWTCQVLKDRRASTVKVMLIPDAATVLGMDIPEPNPVMTLLNADERGHRVASSALSDTDELER